jgi:hypothetical protein
LYGFETSSLTFRGGLRMKVCENRVLRRIFGPEGDKVKGEWRNCKMKILMICTAHQIFFGSIAKINIYST